MVDRILYEGSDSSIIVGDITRKDLRTLKPGTWLNDIVINGYLDLIIKRCKEHPKLYPKCHYMTSYFYTTLKRGGKFDYSRVRRWIKFDLFEFDKVIIPIHLGNHWTMAVIQVNDRHIDYYDSLGGRHSCVEDLKKWMMEEHKDKRKIELKDKWTHTYHRDIPMQQNGYELWCFCLSFC